MQNAKDFLADMGLDLDEAIEADRNLMMRKPRDRRICLCGHAVARHDEFNGLVSCVVGKMTCPCRRVQPVIETDDTRPFLRKTEGAANLHALTRGIAASADKGGKFQWIDGARVCHKCETAEGRLTPVPVSANGIPQSYATGFDALLCDQCRLNH